MMFSEKVIIFGAFVVVTKPILFVSVIHVNYIFHESQCFKMYSPNCLVIFDDIVSPAPPPQKKVNLIRN